MGGGLGGLLSGADTLCGCAAVRGSRVGKVGWDMGVGLCVAHVGRGILGEPAWWRSRWGGASWRRAGGRAW